MPLAGSVVQAPCNLPEEAAFQVADQETRFCIYLVAAYAQEELWVKCSYIDPGGGLYQLPQ